MAEAQTIAAERRSDDEIAELKASWSSDPIWDIEDTEGFEAHRDELTAFRLQSEERWEREREERLTRKAEQIGLPGNLVAAAYVEAMEGRFERRIATLEEQVERLEGEVEKAARR